MIKRVKINDIKPDPSQPRKIFNAKHIEGLAKNLEVEGIINPIEVDPNLMIITGECRWRAAKLAGWTEVPVNINSTSLSAFKRFRRQMAENLHQSAAGGSAPMNAIDVAKGYQKLLKMMGYDFTPGEKWQGRDKGMSKLSKELGVSQVTIGEYLTLLSQPKYVLEDIAKGRPRTVYRETDAAPEEYRERLKQAISDGRITNRLDIRRFKKVALLKPDLAEIEFMRITQKQSEDANRILNRAVELGLAMKSIDPAKLSQEDKKMIHLQLGSVRGSISNFIYKLKS